MITNSHQYDDVNQARSNGSKYGLGNYESRLNLGTSGTRSNHGGYNNSGRGQENNLDNLIPQATLARLDKGLGAVARGSASHLQNGNTNYSEAGSKSRNNILA